MGVLFWLMVIFLVCFTVKTTFDYCTSDRFKSNLSKYWMSLVEKTLESMQNNILVANIIVSWMSVLIYLSYET